MGKSGLRFGKKTVELSNLDKVFYPEVGFTKGDVIDYYRAVASVCVPHLKNRALTLKRYPDGVDGNFFYEKRCPPYRPDWMKTVTMRRKRDSKDIEYCMVDSEAALVWAANLGNLELHTSLAKKADVMRPTSLVFDLDPGTGTDVLDCGRVALWLKDVLDDLSLESFCKTSGSKGLQMFVPLNSSVTYERTGPFAHTLARLIESQHAGQVVTKMAKELRVGKVLIDWSQNAEHKTTVSVYSLRARPRPTVSTPISWAELGRAIKASKADRLAFEVKDVLARIEREGDLFASVLTPRQKLPSSDVLAQE
jgi:bifunctional non-homologous end joining protein LigD